MSIARLTLVLFSLPLAALELQATGSTAAAPLYEIWGASFSKNTSHSLHYESSGSAKGLQAIKAGAVNFGAVDVLPSSAELSQAKLLGFPVAVTAIVPVINLAGIKPGQLKLNSDVLSQILRSKISKWNDPAITALNPDLTLPGKPIKLIVRADGSGSTYVLSEYLSLTSPDWKISMGTGYSLNWGSSALAQKGSKAVAAAVKASDGAIGYVDYSQVTQLGLCDVRLSNMAGRFAKVNLSSITDAMLNSGWVSKGAFEEKLINRAGGNTWPIVSGTYVLLPKVVERTAGTVLVDFFIRSFISGDKAVSAVSMIQLPDTIKSKATTTLRQVRDQQGQNLPMNFM